VPQAGTLVRQGGDEFTFMAPGTVTAAQLATAITAALAASAVIGGRHRQLRASVGVHTGTGDAWQALACADAAMYTAKTHGGDQVLIYDADRDGVPQPDGTRPVVRRRDRTAVRDTATPAPGGTPSAGPGSRRCTTAP
jgi:predicted signal transduction protein with EAL and GGDEF domain